MLGWLAALAIAIWAVVQGPALIRKAETAAAVGARVGCSCRFVAGRPLPDCRRDFEPGMGFVMLTEDTRTITARIPLLARDSATFVPGAGCILERLPN